MRRRILRAAVIAGLLGPANVYASPDTLTLTLEPIVTGLSSPVFLTHAPGDTNRLFVVEQPGLIKIIRNSNVETIPFLDISSAVTFGGERGLLGLAFHPDFPDSNYIYVNYTRTETAQLQTVVSRFEVSIDPDLADPASEQVLLTVNQFEDNHNGGMIAFGRDGYLYVGMGDGGGGGDPQQTAQDSTSLLGKMLRLDINTVPASAAPDNPFVGNPAAFDEIWAFGLRNPWRWSFDRMTGDMWIGDVGQRFWEEIDFEPAESAGGLNYGWSITEGNSCFSPPSGCNITGLNLPTLEYFHESGRCSVTGGYVYRGCAIPELFGWYLFGDFCTSEIWRYKQGENGDQPVLLPLGATGGLSAFGENIFGELYVVSLGGTISKLVHSGASQDWCSASRCCVGLTGNADGDPNGIVDLIDVLRIADAAFLDGTPLECPAAANATGETSCVVDLADILYLAASAFLGGPDPEPCHPLCEI